MKHDKKNLALLVLVATILVFAVVALTAPESRPSISYDRDEAILKQINGLRISMEEVRRGVIRLQGKLKVLRVQGWCPHCRRVVQVDFGNPNQDKPVIKSPKKKQKREARPAFPIGRNVRKKK